jgi:cytochrome c-type biogenesis protein CcmH/NrfG
MSYTAKRVILLVMAWGLLVFTGWQVRENLTAAQPSLTPVAVAAPGPTATPDEATALQAELDRNPNDIVAITRLARILYDQQDYANAGLLYQRAIQLDPHNVDVLVQLAATQFYQQQFDPARTTLLQAVALAPDRPDVHLLLGLALSRTTPPDVAGATREWQTVIQEAPDTAFAQQAQDLLNGLAPATPGASQ